MIPEKPGELFYQDGEYLRGSLKLPPGSLAFTAGFTLFETIRIDASGRGFRIPDHAERMKRSAAALGLDRAPDASLICDAAAVLARENSIETGRLRVLLSALEPGSSTLVIHASAWTPMTWRDRMRGLRGIVMPFTRSRRSPISGHKTANHLEAALARLGMNSKEEGLILNDAGRVCEGLYSNVFAVKDGALSTPALSEGCLPGITRLSVLELAGSMGIKAFEGEMAPADLENADGAFVTNALGGVTPLCRVGNRAMARVPCDTTLALMKALDGVAGR